MATETLYATSHIAGNVSSPANAVGAPDGTFTTDTGKTDWTSRWAMGDPSGPLGGVDANSITVRARSSGTGSGTPSYTINLYENGSLVRQLATGTTTSNTPVDLGPFAFDDSEITDETAIEVEIVTSGHGGGPNANSVQVDGITFSAEVSGASTQNLAGSLFQKAPSFFAGAVAAGAVDLAGSLFQATPTFPSGAVAATFDLAGTLFQSTPAFSSGVVTPGTVDLAGTLFQSTPTFPTGAVGQAGATQDLTGALFQNTPSFPQGAVAASYDLTGSLFQSTPTFPAGTVAATYDLTGTVFTAVPAFFVGSVGTAGGTQGLTGTLFASDPVFFGGVVAGGAADLLVRMGAPYGRRAVGEPTGGWIVGKATGKWTVDEPKGT